MIIFALLKNMGYAAWRWIRSVELTTRLQIKHPTCIFHQGSIADRESTLGHYNVLFKNSEIINSVLGSHTVVQRNSRICNADVGKFTCVGSRVSIGMGRHATAMVSSHGAFYSVSQPYAKTFCRTDKFNPLKRVQIGNDVTIYENVIIVDGVTIGDGAVIAAGSVVTVDVASFAVVAGNPARFFMWRFDENIRKKLSATKWWDRPDEWLQEHCEHFSDPDKFVALI